MIKFLSKYKNDSLEKISSKKLPQLSSLHFKKTHPYTILPPPFYNLLDPPSKGIK